MYFIEKSDIGDFQNRVIVAMFLDCYKGEIKFHHYVDKFHFVGSISRTPAYSSKLISGDPNPDPSKLQDIYIFNVPPIEEGVKDQGTVYKYAGSHSSRPFTFVTLSSDFIKDYKLFIANPYRFLCEKFGSKDWLKDYPELFQIKPKEKEKKETELPEEIKEPEDMLHYKYKAAPYCDKDLFAKHSGETEAEDVVEIDRFITSLKGTLAFTRPEWLNDPFDCDCEIPIFELFPLLLMSAKSNTIYTGPGSLFSMPNADIKDWWDSLSDEDKQTVIDAFDELADKISQDPESNKEKLDDRFPEDLTKLLSLLNKLKFGQEKSITPSQLRQLVLRYSEIRFNLTNIKDEFRVLSLAGVYNDILMWGYYGNGGKGACLSHRMTDLKHGITNSENAKDAQASICIYGKVAYEKEKPSYTPSQGKGVDNILDYVVESVFTKYEGWKHEGEFRYILMGGNVKDSQAICVDSIVQNCYLGVKAKDTALFNLFDSAGWPIRADQIKRLSKHDKEYRIV